MGSEEPKLIDIRCSCGKLLGRVQEGAAHEHKCPRCKQLMTAVPLKTEPQLKKGEVISIEGHKGLFVLT